MMERLGTNDQFVLAARARISRHRSVDLAGKSETDYKIPNHNDDIQQRHRRFYDDIHHFYRRAQLCTT